MVEKKQLIKSYDIILSEFRIEQNVNFSEAPSKALEKPGQKRKAPQESSPTKEKQQKLSAQRQGEQKKQSEKQEPNQHIKEKQEPQQKKKKETAGKPVFQRMLSSLGLVVWN